MSAINGGVVGQGGEPLQGCVQLCGGSAEKAAASGAEEGVSGKEQSRGMKGDMRFRVSGDLEDFEAQFKLGKYDHVAFGHGLGYVLDALAGGPVDRNAAGCRQRAKPAGVVGMVVGNEDGDEIEAMLAQVGLDHLCVARIDDSRGVPVAQQPDIVVLKCGQWNDLQPGSRRMSSVHVHL